MQKDKKTTLEEAAKQYHERIQFSSRPSFYDAFIAGAEWQKKQNTIRTRYKTRLDCYEQGRQDMREEMMKEAVEGEVYRYDGCQKTATAIIVDIPSESLGDKVKILIVPEKED